MTMEPSDSYLTIIAVSLLFRSARRKRDACADVCPILRDPKSQGEPFFDCRPDYRVSEGCKVFCSKSQYPRPWCMKPTSRMPSSISTTSRSASLRRQSIFCHAGEQLFALAARHAVPTMYWQPSNLPVVQPTK